MAAKSSRSVANIVFIVLLAAVLIGVGDLTLHMTMSALSGPG